MLERVAERPAGRISDVFADAAERQGAYDFVRGRVAPAALTEALAQSTLRAAGAGCVLAVVDGTSLSMTDLAGKKGFGSVGRRELPTRGLKVIDTLAVDPTGLPLGILDLEFWAREAKSSASRYQRRTTGATEVVHWTAAIDRVAERVQAAGSSALFVIDREGDCADILRSIAATKSSFTIRAAQDRRLWTGSLLSRHMKRRPALGTYRFQVPARQGEPARSALMEVRSSSTVLSLPDRAKGSRARTAMPVNVVWAFERGRSRKRQIDWMLMTDQPVGDIAAAIKVVGVYRHRWRIEDFHRTWKAGHCHVEDTQLRRRDHVLRWTTMLAAVAVRTEQLKHLARNEPNAPATTAFSETELLALRAWKKRTKKRTETLPDGVPSIEVAVRWIAEYGGYTGKSSGGPPGSTTIARGLDRFLPYAMGVAHGLEMARK